MKILFAKVKLPDDIPMDPPFFLSCRGDDEFAFLFHADVDNLQFISREEAERIVQDFTGYDVESYIKMALEQFVMV